MPEVIRGLVLLDLPPQEVGLRGAIFFYPEFSFEGEASAVGTIALDDLSAFNQSLRIDPTFCMDGFEPADQFGVFIGCFDAQQ